MAESITTAQSSFAYKVVRYWLPVVAMLLLMYWFSTDALSGENTRGIIESILSWFGYHASPKQLTRINYFVRKGAHFTEYAILAALLFRAFRADSPLRWRLRWSVYSLGVALVWAALDELHQGFTRTRGGSVYDSLLDSSGALFMLIGITIVSRGREKAINEATNR
ncbi:MAG: VanZ family protein [Blastocatellia bacterium]